MIHADRLPSLPGLDVLLQWLFKLRFATQKLVSRRIVSMVCEVVPEGEVRAAPGGGAFSQDVITKCNELCHP